MYKNKQHLVVWIIRYSISFHGSVNYHYRYEEVFEILFFTLTYPQPLFFPFFFLLLLNNVDCKILKKTRINSYLMNNYRYRRENKSQVIRRCCKNNCASRVRSDGIEYVKITDHIHAPNPEEIISNQLLIVA